MTTTLLLLPLHLHLPLPLLLLLLLLLCPIPTHALWPAPSQLTQGCDPVLLSPNFTIGLSTSFSYLNLPEDLQSAISDTLQLISHDHHRPLSPDRGRPVHEKLATLRSNNASVLHRLNLCLSQSTSSWLLSSLRVWSWKHIGLKFVAQDAPYDDFSSLDLLDGIAAEITKPLAERDETYELEIGRPDRADGRLVVATLTAPTSLGLFRGLQTFSQLVYVSTPTKPDHSPSPARSQSTDRAEDTDQQASNDDKSTGDNDESPDSVIRYLLGPLTIKDSPAFPYRGLLLDTSRNFYPLADLRRTIDAMSWAKLSTFHWHITDAQSWPLVLPDHPSLSQRGAYSQDEVYSIDQVKEITAYANSKGVDVMMEIDTPGHTSIIGEAYPHLIACKDAQPWSRYAAEPPAGQLRIADDDALTLIEEIYKYIGEQVPGSLFSSGGDEVNHNCYDEDQPTQTTLGSKNQTLNQALSHFVLKTHDQIRQTGKTPVVWEELVLEENLDLERDTIVAVWKSSSNVRAVAERGYRIVHAASDFAYLDCGLGGWLGKSPDGNSWCDPFKTWQKIYSFDPYANITNTQRKFITGGQVSLWSEQADRQNLDSLVWPRALAAAELYWTGSNQDPRLSLMERLAEALPRLHDMRYRMVQRGIQATALQPHWCALRPGQCDI